MIERPVEIIEESIVKIQAAIDVLIEAAASEGRILSRAGRFEDKKALIQSMIESRVKKYQEALK